MKLHRRLAVTGFSAAAALLAVASVAWACAIVSGPTLNAAEPNRAPAGAVVTVSGVQWAESPVSIRWAIPDSQPLAWAVPSSGRFAVQVTIPAAASGTYYLYAVQDATVRATPFAVEVPVTAQQGSPGPAGSTSGATRGGSGPSGSVGVPASQATSPQAPSPSAQTPAMAAPPPATQSPAMAAPQPATPQSPAIPGAALPATAPEQAPSAGPGGGSLRTASGDLWSGLAPGTSLDSAPSLLDLPKSTRPSSAAVGIGFLTAGLIALLAGAGLAGLRTRRQLA